MASVDELSKFLKLHGFEAYEAALRQAGAENLDQLKQLDIEEINELCDETSMNRNKKELFRIALKGGSYQPTRTHQIGTFLSEYKLTQFSQALQGNGLSQLEMLHSMNDADMKALAKKSKLGVVHRKKFIAACNDFKNGVYTINDNDDNKEMNEPKNVTLVDVCHSRSSILKCKSFARLLEMLNFYNETKRDFSTENKKDGFDLLRDYANNSKIDMAEDLGHVVQCHFNDRKKKKLEKNREFKVAHDKLRSFFGCNLGECQNFGRNNRDKATDKLSNEKEVNFVVDILDSIHVLFCHSYDTAYRMVGMRYIADNDGAAKDDANEVDWKDSKFDNLSKKMKKIRENIDKIVKRETNENNKFNNEIVMDEEKESRYSFGLRCYYWGYYKDNNDEDRHYHPSQRYCDWFVSNKFKDLKDEITQNKVHSLSLDAYNAINRKASKWLESLELKKMKAVSGFERDDCADRCDEYQIHEFDPIKLDHLICLICYTDYTLYSHHFSKSFRKLNAKETNKEFRIRKQNYHWSSKGLRELVELYGTMMQASKIKNYYTAISSELVFSSFVPRLCGPTSTTEQLSVATSFADKQGCIMTFNKNYNSGRLCYFNCGFISHYCNEDEKLFIGGLYTIQISNIRSVRTGHNFINFVAAIAKFSQTLSRSVDPQNKPTKLDSKVIRGLIGDHLGIEKNKFDPFANELFESIVKNTKFVQIDVRCFVTKARQFTDIFCSKECENMIKISDLSKLMNNLYSVCLQWKGDFDHFDVNTNYLDALCLELKSCVNSSLKKLKILNIEKEYADEDWEEFTKRMENIGFVAKVEQRCEGEDNEEVPCLIITRS